MTTISRVSRGRAYDGPDYSFRIDGERQFFVEAKRPSDVWQLNEATQRTLDRLVFIRVCEDRRLEPEELLRPLIELSDPYREFIARLPRMRESYNGGLFEPDLVDRLTVGSTVFADILRGLHTPWSPYRFDVLGVEILGSIYERALGSTITLDEERRVAVELKPEVRKARGVYYTPVSDGSPPLRPRRALRRAVADRQHGRLPA
jgi:hypothetical protein